MEKGYEIRYIRTKNKVRKIVTYSENFNENRVYHQEVLNYLRKHTVNSIFAKAYIPGTSIRKNAVLHMYNDIFIKMDINNFFPSINHKCMAKTLYYEINKKSQISFRECCEIVKRCSVSERGLPLGLVSSPELANLYLKQFDGLFYGELRKLDLDHLIYTRYADDLIVSYKCEFADAKLNTTIINTAERLLSRFHLSLNNRKTKIVNLNISNHVRITGVSIIRKNDNYRHLSVGNKLKNQLFWDIIHAHDFPDEVSEQEVKKIKGILSFVLSVEKKGFDRCYSVNMNKLLSERGYMSLIDMAKDL